MSDSGYVSPIRLQHLLWLPVVAAVAVGAALYGTPHLCVRYVWSGNAAAPVFYRCDYWGAYPFTLNFPLGGDCPVVLFARSAS